MTRLRLIGSDTLRSFRTRNFRIYFLGQVISQAGTWLQLIAQTLLMLRLSGSATSLGFLAAVQFTPMLLLGPFAGLLADRLDKRRIMFVTQSLMMVPALLLGVLTISGQVTTLWVFVLAAVTGTGNAFDNPPRRVILSELVPPEDIANAVSLNSTMMTLARVVGPALAALMITTVGIGWCFIVNALSFVAGIVAVARLDRAAMSPAMRVPRQSGQVRAGLAYLWAEPDLRRAMIVLAVVSTLAFNWPIVLPLFSADVLSGNERTYLMLTLVIAAGSLVGALAVARLRTIHLQTVMRLGLAYGVAMLAFALVPSTWAAVTVGVVLGGFSISYLSSTASLLQTRAVPEMRGRVIALHAVVFLGSVPIGGPIAGAVTEWWGPRAGVLAGAIPTILTAGWAVWACRVRRLSPGSEPGSPTTHPGAPTTVQLAPAG